MPPTGGRLSGTNNVQRSLDSLDRTLNRLIGVQQAVARAGQAVSGLSRITYNPLGSASNPTGNGPTSASGPGGQAPGSPNGGGARFGGYTSPNGRLSIPASRPINNGGRGGNPSQPMRSNGGGGQTNRSNGGGLAPVAAAMGGIGTLAAMAGSSSDNMTLDYLAQWGSGFDGISTTSGERKYTMQQTVGVRGGSGNAIAFNTQDAASGMFALRRGVGDLTSQRGQNARSAMSAFGLYSPGLGAASSARMATSLYTPQAYLGLQQLGLGTSVQGQGGMSFSQLADNMMKRTYGSTQISGKRMNIGLSDTGSLNFGINNVAPTLGWDSSQTEAFREYVQQRNKAMNNGMSSADFDKFSDQAVNANTKDLRDTARKQLKDKGKVDVSSMVQRSKDSTAQSSLRTGLNNEEFANNFERASGAVELFNRAMNKLNDNPIMRNLVGGAGGWKGQGSSIFGGASDVPEAGMTATARSSPTPDNSGTKTTAKPTNNASLAKVVSAIHQQFGRDYIWGGESPAEGGFDCSGIVDWGLRKSGYPLAKGSRLTTMNAKNLLKGKWVPVGQKKPGDILMTGDQGHMELYIGGGKTVGSRGGKSRRRPGVGEYAEGGRFSKALRFLGNMGDIASISNSTMPYNTDKTQNDQPGGQMVGGGDVGGNFGSQEEADVVAAALSGFGGSGAVPFGGTQMGPPGQTAGNPAAPADPGDLGDGGTSAASAKALAQKMMAGYGWSGGAEWGALEQLWQHESGWNYKARNKSSGALGIPQALGHKLPAGYASSASVQLKWGMNYIKSRYGDPASAWAFWQHPKNSPAGSSTHWYDKGAWEIEQDETARIHKGEMVLPAKQADTIRAALLKDSFYAVTTSSGSKKGSGGGVSLTFGANAISIQVQGASTPEAMGDAAKQFVAALQKQDLYNQIAQGVGRATA